MGTSPTDTAKVDYTTRLLSLEGAWWKRLLDVQAPYRWNLKRLQLGRVLDVGCGIGRNLYFLDRGSVGIDHNSHSVAAARTRGCVAFEPTEFGQTEYAREGAFDSMLLAHVLEHMSRADGVQLVRAYLPYVRAGGKVVLITPQEAGYRSDSSHVEFMDFEKLRGVLQESGASVARNYSFPFPRLVGKVFRYNEFVVVGVK